MSPKINIKLFGTVQATLALTLAKKLLITPGKRQTFCS